MLSSIDLLFAVQGAESFKEVVVNASHSAKDRDVKKWQVILWKKFELNFQLFLLLRICCLCLFQLNCSLPAGGTDWENVKEWKEKVERKKRAQMEKGRRKKEKGWNMEMPWQEKCDLNLTRCLCLCWLPCLLGSICCSFHCNKKVLDFQTFWCILAVSAVVSS